MSTELHDYHKLIDSLRNRFTWTNINIIFPRLNLKKSTSWGHTAAMLKAAIDRNDVAVIQGLDELFSYYREAVLVGNKAIQIYPQKKSKIDEILDHASDMATDKGVLSDEFPFYIPESRFQEIQDDHLSLVKVYTSESGAILVYGSKKVATTREKIFHSEIPDGAKDFFSEYDTIYGDKRMPWIYWDVVFVNHAKGQIEFRLDLGKGLVRNDVEKGLKMLRRAFLNTCSSTLGHEVYLGDPANFFPLIKKLYFSHDEGKVVELGFVTVTNSSKFEKMRRTGQDLRKELFHQGGMEKVDNRITPFKIAIVWPDSRESIGAVNLLELRIDGAFRRNLKKEEPLSIAEIQNCLSQGDLDFVMEKIEGYSKRPTA